MADAHAKPQHDYHLVNPSPWPIVGSISAFFLAVGLIGWMHHMYAIAPLVFGAGVIGVLYAIGMKGNPSAFPVFFASFAPSRCTVGRCPMQ